MLDMSPASVTRTLEYNRWVGTKQDLANAGEIALAALPPKEDGSRECSIQIDERKGSLSYKLESLDEFRNLPDLDLPQITAIRFDLGDWMGPSVAIRVVRKNSLSPVLRAEVKGDDRVWVEGLSRRLEDTLDHGRRWPRWFQRDQIFFAIPVLASILAVVGSPAAEALGLAKRNGRWDTWEIIGTAGGPLLAVAAGLALVWLLPDLEILAPGQRRRVAKFRGWLIAAVAAIVLSLVGSVIYANT
jgi:hypothetical protein